MKVYKVIEELTKTIKNIYIKEEDAIHASDCFNSLGYDKHSVEEHEVIE